MEEGNWEETVQKEVGYERSLVCADFDVEEITVVELQVGHAPAGHINWANLFERDATGRHTVHNIQRLFYSFSL